MSRYSPHQNVVNYNAHGEHDRFLLGVLLVALGETFLVGMGAVVKHLSQELPLVQIVFFRNFFALILLFPLVVKVGLPYLKTRQLHTHFLRGLFGVIAIFCMFYTFANLRLTEAVLLKATSPIMLSLMAWLILREHLNGLSWCAIGLAFIGVLIMMQPNELDLTISLGFIAGISAALLASLAKVMVRKLGRTEPSEVIVFYFSAFATAFTLPFMILAWQPVADDQWLFLLLIAVLASLGQLCLTKAYTVVKAGRIAMFSYLSLPIAALLGWLLWSETIDLALLAGVLIIVAAGAINFYGNRRLGKN